jgi:aminoglycoside phosphotransferase (APT) family kinase protein
LGEQTDTTIGRDRIQTIWEAYRLGPVETLAAPERGSVNLCFLVNDELVIRFQVRHPQFAKLRTEKIACDLLRPSSVPVPEAVVLDETKTLVPYPFLITSRLPGETLLDSWSVLDRRARERLAFEAGRYKALIHEHRFERFGSLSRLADGGFPSWTSYLHDYFGRHARRARDLGILDGAILERIEQLLHRFEPLFAQVTHGSLLHSDYQFENILQQAGTITGIIDFEWALSGDPAFDCNIDSQLESTCPGSLEPFYGGYETIRPRDEHHARKARVYTLLLHLENVASWDDQPESEWYRGEQRSLTELLASLESQA